MSLVTTTISFFPSWEIYIDFHLHHYFSHPSEELSVLFEEGEAVKLHLSLIFFIFWDPSFSIYDGDRIWLVKKDKSCCRSNWRRLPIWFPHIIFSLIFSYIIWGKDFSEHHKLEVYVNMIIISQGFFLIYSLLFRGRKMEISFSSDILEPENCQLNGFKHHHHHLSLSLFSSDIFYSSCFC